MIFMFLRFRTSTCWLGCCFLWAIGFPVVAQQFRIPQRVEFSEAVQLPEADNPTRSRLDTIERFLEAQQWDEAIEALDRLMDVAGEQLVPLADPEQPQDGFVRYIPLRVYGQLRLAALHGTAEEALAMYRSRLDGPARAALQEALDSQQVARLRAVVDEYVLSSVGDRALFHLGEFELNRGNFGRARQAWQQLHPRSLPGPEHRNTVSEGRMSPGSDGEASAADVGRVRTAGPIYPDTRVDLADINARLVLVSLLEGSAERAEEELEQFARWHGDRAGTLAGQTGPYRELLGRMLEESRDWSPPCPPRDWPTLGGAYTRNRLARG